MNKYHKDREELYNEVIQDYSEVEHFNIIEDEKQDIISNIVDLYENYGESVYRVIRLKDFSIEELFDYEYLEIQVQTHFDNI